MSIIRFREADCKNCYKCLRSCPVKAITFSADQQAQINDKSCILCGNCLSVCPQNAKIVRNDVEKVRGWLGRKEKVYVSLAPSYVAAFGRVDLEGMTAALRQLGFVHVEETAVGAAEVSKEYVRLMQDKGMANILSTACPTIVSLVEKHYPELLGLLAPVVSPMVAHARMLRATFGPRIRVVFIGPCLSKKEEASDVIHAGAVDAVLTFEELEAWMQEERIEIDMLAGQVRQADATGAARLYPAPGGILKTLDRKDRKPYTCISIDGMDRCRTVLESLQSGLVDRHFIEMSACAGSCLEGPCRKVLPGGYLVSRDRLVSSWRATASGCVKSGERPAVTEVVATTARTIKKAPRIQLTRRFSDKRAEEAVPSEAVIRGILHSIGKYTPEKELNCGACGYPTCREKAVAVFRNKAQLTMCLPYMQERAASMSNLILGTTPNAILALDSDGNIQEINRAARHLLAMEDKDVAGKPVFQYLDSPELVLALDEGQNVIDQRVRYDRYGLTVEQTLVFVPDQRLAVLILRNVTEEEAEREKRQQVREETVEIAQKVIEKQMRVAQEIASLLGETTAETKVALTRLKKSILLEGGGKP